MFEELYEIMTIIFFVCAYENIYIINMYAINCFSTKIRAESEYRDTNTTRR